MIQNCPTEMITEEQMAFRTINKGYIPEEPKDDILAA
jgi:hypothetical protein